jgi:asparagine synthase (glutamine-hydrolysing)
MCGILGTNLPVPPAQFQSALDLIAHRGPDDEGTFRQERLTLGHRRLAILDRSPAGHQPMSTPDGKVWIVFNGEIYNHLDLRRELDPRVHYRGHSDTETILQGYRQYGTAVIRKLNGIFAFAIYDIDKQLLVLARDHLGVKPLYYFLKEGQFGFSSELKALVKLGLPCGDLDSRTLLTYPSFLWSPGTGTPFKDVRKLAPGHFLSIPVGNPSAAVETKFYEIPFDGTRLQQSEAALTDELDERLQTAIRRQLLSDVPVGSYLSGGLDSSLIVAIARKQLGSSFDCYTVNPLSPIGDKVDGMVNDLDYARRVAEVLDVRLHEVEAKADLLENLDDTVWHLDEPQGDPATLLVWEISKLAREHGNVVLLSGAGGDDVFSGYRRHQALRMEWMFRAVPRGMGRAIRSLFNGCSIGNDKVRRLKKLSAGLGLTRLERLTSYYRWTELENLRTFFQPGFLGREEFDPTSILLDSMSAIAQETSDLNLLLFWDLKFFLTDHNLNYTDKMSMAVGVETRVPFLDHELVDFACHLPVDLKMRGWTTKYLLRKVAERYLPKDVIYRSKTGFGAPLRKWVLSGELDRQVSRMVNDRGPVREVLNLPRIQEFAARTLKGTEDGAYTILCLLAIDSWLKQFKFGIGPAEGRLSLMRSR